MADVGPAIFALNASKHQDKGILQKGIDKTKEIAEDIKEGAKNMVTLGTPTAEASGIHVNKAEDRCIDKVRPYFQCFLVSFSILDLRGPR